MVQTAVADPTMRSGQLIQGPWPEDVDSFVAEGALAAGNLVEYGTDPERQVQELATLPVADVDAIATAAVVNSAVAAQSITAGAFDGTIAGDRIAPCRTLTITFDAHVDWNTPSGECRVDFYGVNADGAEMKLDSIAKPNGSGAGTYATAVPAAMCTRIDLEACNGANGTATVGVSLDRVAISQTDAPGIALYESIMEPYSATREFEDEDEVSVITRGRVCSIPEHAVSIGDAVYVRVVAAGADLCGQLTGQDGAETPSVYAKLSGARWVSSALADHVAKVELGG